MAHSNLAARPTIGVLAGWQIYWTARPLSYLNPIFRGVIQAAADLGCNLLLGCGLGPTASASDPLRPAWPFPAPDTDFVPIGPWNTDGLIAIVPLHSAARSHDLQQVRAVHLLEVAPRVRIRHAGRGHVQRPLAAPAEHRRAGRRVLEPALGHADDRAPAAQRVVQPPPQARPARRVEVHVAVHHDDLRQRRHPLQQRQDARQLAAVELPRLVRGDRGDRCGSSATGVASSQSRNSTPAATAPSPW